MLAAFNYTEPPFYAMLMGTAGMIVLLIFFGWLRRVVIGMLGGGLGAAAIAWFVLARSSGDPVDISLVRVFATPTFGVLGAFACAFAGFCGKWIGQPPRN